MRTRMILISTAAAVLVMLAAPASADHSRVAVSVHYGPAYLHYVDHGYYFDGYHRYVPVQRYRHDHRKAYRKAKHHKRYRYDHPHRWRGRADWCRVGQRHWH